MLSNFCPLCGIIIARVRHVVPGDVPTFPLQWFQELRVVRSVEGISSPFVSGIGFLSFNGLVTAHSDYKVDYTGRSAGFSDSEPYRTLCESYQFWAFALHSACWDILLLRLRHGVNDRHIVASQLFYVLLSIVWNENNYLIKGYDYGDATRYSGNLEAFFTTDDGRLSYFRSNPCQLYGFKTAAEITAKQLPSPKIDLGTAYPTLLHHEGLFSRVPVEIIHMILNWLPSRDVCSFRIASRYIALISTTEALPQAFWASRFGPGLEMEFALPHVDGDSQFIDWQERYFAVKRTLQSPDGFGPLRHRKRIWTTISPICRLIESLLTNSDRRGVVTTWDDISPLSFQSDLPDLAVGRVFRALSVAGSYPYLLFEGCREIETRSLIWPQSSELKGYTVGISLISLDDGTFVSGIRILQNHVQNHAQNSLGLINKSSETLIHIEPNISLEGFEVAVCLEGIVGLKPILGGSNCAEQRYIGSVSNRRPGIAFGRLLPRQGKRTFALSAGMDACKLTSIGLVEVNRYPRSLDALRRLYLTEHHVRLEDVLWTPSLPSRDASVQVFPTNAIGGKFQPLMNVDFGGIDGSRLGSLTGVVAHMGRLPYLIRGLEFFYSDSRSKAYGSTNLLERSFFVDGAGGERINEAKVQLSDELKYVDRIQSLEISTNWGNTVIFAYPEVKTSEHHPPLKVLRAAEGEVVTGFTVGMGIRTPVFQSFGLQTQRISLPQLSTKPDERAKSALSPHLAYAPESNTASIHRFSYRTLFSRASLDNVRRIRFSKGINDRVRIDTEISGLWIDYHGATQPTIVGQWLAEVGSFDLGEAEKITEISTWVSRDRRESIDGPQLGRIVAISISTSLQRSSEFVGTKKEGAMRLKFRANQFEKLNTIMWAYNYTADHLRVFTERVGSHDLILCPKGSQSWIVPEKLFWENGDGDDPDRLATGRIYSKPGAIIGLSFVYFSGTVSGIGSTEGDIESFDARDRRLTGLQVHSTKDVIKELTFHTEPAGNDQEDGSQPNYMKLKSHTFIASSAGEPPPPNHSMYDLLETQKPRAQHASSRSTNYIHHEEQLPVTRASFVGLWGTGDELRKLGVVLKNGDGD